MNIQTLIEKWELEIAKVTPKEDYSGKWYDEEWSNGRYGAISEFLADVKQLNLPLVSHSTSSNINDYDDTYEDEEDPDYDDSHECCDECGCYHGHNPWCGEYCG